MVLTVVCFAVALLSLALALRAKRIRDEREMEQHSITAEERINDIPILGSERKYHWVLGRRPDDHPGLSDLGL
jgi:nuclear transport factor 2 (NTF2) superfamily protein